MRKLNEQGSLAVPLAVVSALFVLTLIFAGWAFVGMQDYKNNSDEKAAAAAKVAAAEESKKKDAEFAEASKSPLKTFNSGLETTGNLSFQYPKSWSAYTSSDSDNEAIFNGYFHPDVVPNSATTNFALRVEVTEQKYEEVLKEISSQESGDKTVTVGAYRPSKVPSVLGAIVASSGDEKNTKTVNMVILPLRDKTIKIWTEGETYLNDFTNSILPSVTFAP